MLMDQILQKASGSTEWEIEVGKNFVITGIFCLQVIVTFEVIIYVILFIHLHAYNQELTKQKLGLPIETINKRKRRNVISFLGEFATFVVETVFGIFMELVILFYGSDQIIWFLPFFAIFSQAALIITFFLASPELKRFYFDFE